MRLPALLVLLPALAVAQSPTAQPPTTQPPTAQPPASAPAPQAAPAPQTTPATASDPQKGIGGAVAPAVLPAGAISGYALIGAPELAVGYRQGFGLVELEARARADYFRVALAAEGVLRLGLFDNGTVAVAPTFGLGLVGNTGATYLDEQNFPGVFLRILPGAVATYRVADTVALLTAVDLPIDLTLQTGGGSRAALLGGGGAEVYVGQDTSLVVLGQLGAETLRAPQRESVWRATWRLQVGLGLRFF